MNTSEIEEEISFQEHFAYLYKNLKSLILIFVALSVIGISAFLNYFNLKSESYFSQYSFSIENDLIKKVLSPSYIINMDNFILAAKESNIDEKINLRDFLSTFSIVSGEVHSNRFIDHVNNENFEILAKSIAIEPELLKEYFEDITEHSDNYRTLIVNHNDLLMSDVAQDLFVSNLFKITNKKLNSEFNLSPIKLSNLSYTNNSSENLNIWILYAKEFLTTASSYITILKDFSYATPSVSINIDQLEDQLSIIVSQFRYFLSGEEGVSSLIIDTNNIEIESLELQIELLEDIISSLDNESSSNVASGIADSSTRENIAIDSDSFSKILNIGSDLSNAEIKAKYVDLLYQKTSSKFNIMKENELFEYKKDTNFNLSTDYLDSAMSGISTDINHYLRIVSSLGDYSKPIKLLTISRSEKVSISSQLRSSLIMIFTTSLLVSFSIIILKGILRNRRV